MRRMFLLLILALTLPSGSALAQSSTCTTRYNAILQRYDTTCGDGSSATQRYNDLMQRYETTIQRRVPEVHPYPLDSYRSILPPMEYIERRHCTTTYNVITGAYDTTCR